jgi:hypothetical protein
MTRVMLEPGLVIEFDQDKFKNIRVELTEPDSSQREKYSLLTYDGRTTVLPVQKKKKVLQ